MIVKASIAIQHKTHQFQQFLLLLMLMLFSNSGRALDYTLNGSKKISVAYTITVDQSGKGNFTKIQEAINSIPAHNSKWIRIKISPGKYREKVIIKSSRPYIFLEGSSSRTTVIEWDDHQSAATSCTFVSDAGNFMAKGISFKNSYNVPPQMLDSSSQVAPALAACVKGDKSSFYQCGFVGLQDTLWDDQGRHYFHECYIEGGVDFIWGGGQSIYEQCVISLNIKQHAPEKVLGYITAQARNSSTDTSGYVFKNCIFNGRGKALLGRAYGAYSRVIIVNSKMSDIVQPEGWNAWNNNGHTENIVYAESGCSGPGADTSKRVPWEKKLGLAELKHFTSISYIDNDGWIEQQKQLWH